MAGYEPLSLAELLSLLAERDRRIAQLEAENAGLARRVARLERLISRNSGNSSMPPSADDRPGRRAPREKPRRGSAAKHGENVLTALRDAITGNPWMPPVSDPP